MDIAIGLIVGLVVGAFLTFGVLILTAGSPGGVFEGLGIASKAKKDPSFAAKLNAILAGADIKPVEPPKPTRPDGTPLRMLALLQAEARLVDFLMEDISGARRCPDRPGGARDSQEGRGGAPSSTRPSNRC